MTVSNSSAPRSRPARRRSFSPTLDGLERREVLSTIAGIARPAPIVEAVSDLNTLVVNYAKSHLGQKVGGGECAHLANEALRVAGADFVGSDPGNGDYVWGSLVTTLSANRDSNASAVCKPGDIIQFQNVRLSSGWIADHHTAIVAAVDSKGRPTQVYEQNVGVSGKGAGYHDRHDRLDTVAINSKTVTAGTVKIYRPVRRVDAPRTLQFSVVNDTTASQNVTIYFNGKASSTFSLTSASTLNSYTIRKSSWTGSATASWSIGINGKIISLANAAGYQVYTLSGKASIRAI